MSALNSFSKPPESDFSGSGKSSPGNNLNVGNDKGSNSGNNPDTSGDLPKGKLPPVAKEKPGFLASSGGDSNEGGDFPNEGGDHDKVEETDGDHNEKKQKNEEGTKTAKKAVKKILKKIRPKKSTK